MSRRTTPRWFAAAASLLLVAVLPGAATAAPGVPPPLPFVSQLDLSCYRTEGYKPPPTTVTLKHLNPVLAELPPEKVELGAREQLCVPVAKNGAIPPPGILDYVRWVDLSCYRIEGRAADFPLTLSQLNPVVRKLGIQDAPVTMLSPEQLCVPVAKNGELPPPEILSFVRHIDLECYALRVLGIPGRPFPLTLGHLNPVLADRPKTDVKVGNARQLCVPVTKGGDEVTREVLDTVQWLDLAKYDVTTGPSVIGPVTLKLTHLNPVLAHLPGEQVVLTEPTQLGLPVAKNGKLPPSD
ncbi:hypothetical protein GCM10027598_53830 [Amycolatopsis oliviviridis]|uniref:Secreted protein n=1 Tax=Amycolatopsis oliviviridis TaxID=1471590 RepID=A0ABQ3ME14_9PSEU|nr:hypothetical protein [Amycolatopsis oliviviridis]GHH35499.1 hypothetical protein GCM10017790_77050 [Amycolatopsis oliviviridis]